MELTVSKVNEYIKNMFEYEPALNNIRVKGEVSNCKYHTSGHIYFTIKDAGGQLSCVLFYGSRAGLKFKLETGQSVIVTGKISVYERDGKYQLYARQIEKDGLGNLHEEFEKLKLKLSKEGLFDASHKKMIPAYAKKIGIVTSATGAAISDIINVSKRRNPYVELYLCPVMVQGEQAYISIAEGIKKMDNAGVDVMIVGRGGGSMEDLWAFNNEMVARACYESKTPVISAVGHEIDYTIIDFVADLRAPTPSAAAELAVFDYDEFLDRLRYIKKQLDNIMDTRINIVKGKRDNLALRLSHNSPVNKLNEKKQLVDELTDKLKSAMDSTLADKKHIISILLHRLEGVSPLKKLSQGYSYVTDDDNNNINCVENVRINDNINVTMTDGVIKATVRSVEKLN